MKRLLAIIVLGLFISLSNSFANSTCVRGKDIDGRNVIDCSTSGGGFYREGDPGSGMFRNDYGHEDFKTQRQIESENQ